MNPAETIQQYHAALKNLIWQGEVMRSAVAFRERNDIEPDGPLSDTLMAIYHSHLRRVAGTGSPAECDEIVNKLKGEANTKHTAAVSKPGGAGSPVSLPTK